MKRYQQTPQWTQRLFETVQSCWNYQTPCGCINFQAFHDPNIGAWQIKAAPIFQELYGGENDGQKIWSGFFFDMGAFQRRKGVWIEEQAFFSASNVSELPKIATKGKFEGHDILLEIYLEPIPNTQIKEVVNVLTNEVTPANEDQDYSEEVISTWNPDEDDDNENENDKDE